MPSSQSWLCEPDNFLTIPFFENYVTHVWSASQTPESHFFIVQVDDVSFDF